MDDVKPSAPPPCPPAEDEEGTDKEMGKEGSGTKSVRAFWGVWAISSEQADLLMRSCSCTSSILCSFMGSFIYSFNK